MRNLERLHGGSKGGEVEGWAGTVETKGGIKRKVHTLYPEALLEISSVLPWMLSIGLDWVGMFSLAVWATVWSWGTSVMMAVYLLCQDCVVFDIRMFLVVEDCWLMNVFKNRLATAILEAFCIGSGGRLR